MGGWGHIFYCWFWLFRPKTIGEQRGCRPPPVSIFMTPPHQSSNRPHPLEKGFLTPSPDFGLFDWWRIFLEIFFLKILPPKKILAGSRRPNFFPRKSCNFSVKFGDFLKFATPPDRGWKFFLWPPSNTKELAHLCLKQVPASGGEIFFFPEFFL